MKTIKKIWICNTEELTEGQYKQIEVNYNNTLSKAQGWERVVGVQSEIKENEVEKDER